MRNFVATILVFLVFVTACAPGNTPGSIATPPDLAEEVMATATLAAKTQVPATATQQPTTAPTLTPTLQPALFDRTGYRQFAITRSYYPGFDDFRGDRGYSEISSALSPDGNLIAISACWGSLYNTLACQTEKSGFLVVIDANSGEVLNEIPLGDSWPGPVTFTPDGKNLIFSNDELKVNLWDLTTNKLIRTLHTVNRTKATYYPDVAVAPDWSSFASVIQNTLYVWNPAGGKLFQAAAYNTRASAALSYSADGSRLVVFSPDHIGLDVYSTSDWKLARRLLLSDIWKAEISPDGRLVAALTAENRNVVVWDVDSGEQLADITPEVRGFSLQFNPIGDLLVIAGYGNLDNKDGYPTIGALYETQTWSYVDTLYSFSSEGKFRFNRDGSRMIVFGAYANTLWELPDAKLLAGFEVVRQFQQALADGDFTAAASLFEVIEGEEEYLLDMGIDANDLAGSFSALCEAGTIFCLPVKELVMMGYDYDALTYLVRLEDSSGGVFTSPEGATILYIYLEAGIDGQLRVIYPAQDL